MASIQDRFTELQPKPDLDHHHSITNRDRSRLMGNFGSRPDVCLGSGGKTDLTTVSKSGKHGPATLFRPKNLTFNFSQQGYQPRDPKRISLGANSTDLSKPITHSSILDFLDFVDLFKVFSIRMRKDLKELFEHHASSPGTPSSKTQLDICERHFTNKQLGEYRTLKHIPTKTDDRFEVIRSDRSYILHFQV